MPSDRSQFALWDAALRGRRAAHEAERRRVLAELLAWLDAHAAEYQLDEVWIFGSLLHPYRFGPRSDIDLALVADPDLRQFQIAAALSAALDRDADVLLLDDCPFASGIVEEGLRWMRSKSVA